MKWPVIIILVLIMPNLEKWELPPKIPPGTVIPICRNNPIFWYKKNLS